MAFAADQVRVALLPLITELGLALKLTVGPGTSRRPSRTAPRCRRLPCRSGCRWRSPSARPSTANRSLLWLPDQAPEAVQEVALVADQFRVALLPLVMALGPTLKVTVGCGCLDGHRRGLGRRAAGSSAGQRIGRIGGENSGGLRAAHRLGARPAARG